MGLTDLPSAALSTVTDPVSNLVKGFEGLIFGKKVRPEFGSDFPEGFQIIEVIDGVENHDTMLRLTGNMIPQIPFEWGGEQRLVKDYYPGNPEPAVQALGAKEGDVTIHGKFKDKRLKFDTKTYGVSYKVADYLDGLRKRGNLCKFVLGPWVRYGFIEKTDFKLEKLSGVEYSISLFIIGNTPPTNGKIIAKSKDLPTAATKALIDAMSNFVVNNSVAETEKTMNKNIAFILNNAIGTVAAAVNLVTNFANSYITAAEDITSSINRALGLIKNARTNICVFQRRIGALSMQYNSLSTNTKASTNFTSAIQSQQRLANAVSTSGTLAALLASMQKQFEAIARTTPLARYKVVAGDTLQKVSMKFYRSADHWDAIYDHNKLTTTVLAQGMMLEIPRL